MLQQIRRIIILLLSLQVVSIVFLWTLDALNQVSEGIFALFLAVDLISFAIVSYLYRSEKMREMPHRSWIVIGCVLILILIFASLFLA